jgi:hypothetical protein
MKTPGLGSLETETQDQVSLQGTPQPRHLTLHNVLRQVSPAHLVFRMPRRALKLQRAGRSDLELTDK